MAAYTAVWTPGPKTLSTTVVDKVTLSEPRPYLYVENTTGATTLQVTVARGADPADPVAGADVYTVPTGRSRVIPLTEVAEGTSSSSTVVVKILGNGNVYLVEAND